MQEIQSWKTVILLLFGYICLYTSLQNHFLKIPIQLCWLLMWLVQAIPGLNAQTIDNLSAKQTHFDSLIARANQVYDAKPDLSFQFAQQALDYAARNKMELGQALAKVTIAKTEILKGDLEPAVKHLKDAVVIFEKTNKQERLAKCYDLLSIAMSKIEKGRESIELLLKARDIYRRIGLTSGLRSCLMNLSNEYYYAKEYEKGLAALAEAKQYTEKNSSQWFYYYINMGLIREGQKKYEAAKVQFDSCIAISKRHHMLDAEITAITDVATILRKTRKTKEAIQNYETAVDMAENAHLPLEESDALQELILAYESVGDYKKAFQAQRRLKAISDSVFTVQKVKNVAAIEKKLRLSEKEKTIALQKLSMEEGARRQEANERRMTWLIAGASLLVIGLFFTVFIYLRTERQKREIEKQKTTVERLNILSQKIFSVIAHDFKSPLITLQMLTDLLDRDHISQSELNAYTADVRNQITQSHQILENLLNWARTELNLSQRSNSSSDPFLISGEIERELHLMAAKKNITISNKVPENQLLKIPPDILRIIIRNLVSNAIKYSHEKSEVTIGLSTPGGIYVKDEGVGIDHSKMSELFTGTVKSKLGTFNETGFGLGLHITHELLGKFNGKIRVEKNIPSGTVFIFTLPLET